MIDGILLTLISLPRIVPGVRALAPEKEIEQFVRATALPELNLHTHIAQLIRSVSIPRLHAERALAGFLEIFVERAVEQGTREMAGFAAGSHRDGRRRRI